MKTYLVTGATGSIGGAVARALIARGAWVIAAGRADQAGKIPPGAEPWPLDLRFHDIAAKNMQKMTNATEPLAGIVHCAGVEVIAPLRTISGVQWDRAMFAAESALAILSGASRAGVVEDGGAVVIVTSAAARQATAGLGAYAAGKAAAEALARCAALELAPRRIRVNCLAPGAVSGAMHDRVMARLPADARAAYERKHPLGIASPEQVAAAALWLLDAEQITGAVVPVDGGLTA